MDQRENRIRREEKQLLYYSWFWSLLLILAVPLACLYTGEGKVLWTELKRILLSPAHETPDYFSVGGLGAALLNAALCGTAVSLIFSLTRVRMNATLLAGYFLVIAHCFYGLNIVNLWFPFLGMLLAGRIRRVSVRDVLHLALFSTSLGPFISDFLFRYGAEAEAGARLSPGGLVLALSFSLIAGFVIPALLPGTTRMHRGYNLYKAGLAIGLFGILAYALFYRTMGIGSAVGPLLRNPLYDAAGCSYQLFMGLFFGIAFAGSLLWGFLAGGKSFKSYAAVWRCDGWQDDFPGKCGLPATLINIGLYGFCVLLYINLAISFTEGVGFTGPTAGVVIAAITFSASGQTPRNVWPILLGYYLLFMAVKGVCLLTGLPQSWSLSSQPYINGMAFATGLCPFTGRYGCGIGILAGFIDAILCTSTSAMHGGFMLYNGGLTAGLTALILLPILEFYKVKQKPFTDDNIQ